MSRVLLIGLGLLVAGIYVLSSSSSRQSYTTKKEPYYNPATVQEDVAASLRRSSSASQLQFYTRLRADRSRLVNQVPHLVSLVADPSVELEDAELEAIGRLIGTLGVDETSLQQSLLKSPTLRVRQLAYYAIREAGRADDSIIRGIVDRVRLPGGPDESGALQALIALGPAALSHVLEALQSHRDFDTAQVGAYLGTLDWDTLERLVPSLRGPDRTTRLQVAMALSRMEDAPPWVVTELVHTLGGNGELENTILLDALSRLPLRDQSVVADTVLSRFRDLDPRHYDSIELTRFLLRSAPTEPHVLSLLAQQLSHTDDDVRRRALVALALAGPSAADYIGPITKLFANEKPRIRILAAVAAWTVGGRSGLLENALRVALVEPGSEHVRTFSDAVFNCGSCPASVTKAVLKHVAAHPRADADTMAHWADVLVCGGEEVVEGLSKMLSQPDPTLRKFAARCLWRLHPSVGIASTEAAAAAVRSALEEGSDDADLIHAAASLATASTDPELRRAMVTMAQDPSSRTWWPVRALGELDLSPEEALGLAHAFGPQLRDDDASTVDRALLGLGELGNASRAVWETIVPLLGSSRFRKDAFALLAKLQALPEGIVSKVTPYLHDWDPQIRAAASIVKWRSSSYEGVISDSSWEYRVAEARLLRPERSEERDILFDWVLYDLHSEVRMAAAQALVGTSVPEIRHGVLDLANSEDMEARVRSYIVRSMQRGS